MLLGCIGDDFTGSSDLANTLAKQGMRVVQYCGVPDAPAADGVEAAVVALKSRSIDPDAAVAQSLQALAWLRQQGVQQVALSGAGPEALLALAAASQTEVQAVATGAHSHTEALFDLSQVAVQMSAQRCQMARIIGFQGEALLDQLSR